MLNMAAIGRVVFVLLLIILSFLFSLENRVINTATKMAGTMQVFFLTLVKANQET